MIDYCLKSSEQYLSYIQDINKFINTKIGRYRSTGALSKHVTHQGLCACIPYCKLTTLLQKGTLVPNPRTHCAVLWVWALGHFIHLSLPRGRTVQLYGFVLWNTSSGFFFTRRHPEAVQCYYVYSTFKDETVVFFVHHIYHY